MGLWSKLTAHPLVPDVASGIKVVPRRAWYPSVDPTRRVCSRCGDSNFLSGALIFVRADVVSVICRTCLDKL